MFILSSHGPYTCVNCGADNYENVYKVYGNSVKSHHRSPSTAGTHLAAKTNSCRLTECEVCHRYVDEYAQLDYNVLFLDAILQKHSFYRHILLNCQISNRSAFKMVTAFLLCETFQRWSTATKPSSSFASKSYLQLELSFYLIFLCVILENALFNIIFYAVFKYATDRSNPQNSTSITSWKLANVYEIFVAIIVSSYGKLLFIPSYLYGCELRVILDQLVYLFFIFSLIQCSAVKGRLSLLSVKPYLIVLVTWCAHYVLFYLCIVSFFQSLFGTSTNDDYFLGVYLK